MRGVGARLLCSRLWLLFAGLLAGCSYEHVAHRPGEHAATPGNGFSLHYVEADDDGWLWHASQASAALAAIREAAAKEDTIVLLYVHGWHHSAACCDGNVEGFKKVLDRLQAELRKPMYEQARRDAHKATGVPQSFSVVGVYVGWRGRSLPGLFDYLTFWGRKSAASRVGQSDFREFMSRLQQAFNEHNRPNGASSRRPQTFLGLVSIGHSFGGQALLDATSPFIEMQLQGAGRAPVYLREPPQRGTRPQLSGALSGFGDLVVLVNPAVEAAAYQRMHALAMGFGYSQAQTPLMLTISADNDGPRHSLFEIGRRIGEIFTLAASREDPRQREMAREALGVHPGQVTHRLAPVDESVALEKSTLESEPEKYCGTETCRFDWYRWRSRPAAVADSIPSDRFTPAVARTIAAFDFSQPLSFADVHLSRLAGAIDYQPLIVASAHPGVIDGHNGMFSEPLMDFLVRYIGFIEAKRYLQTAQRRGWMAPSSP